MNYATIEKGQKCGKDRAYHNIIDSSLLLLFTRINNFLSIIIFEIIHKYPQAECF